MCGCMVLNAGKNLHTGVWLCCWGFPGACERCHAYPLSGLYANWSGSIRESVSSVMWVFMTLSIALITREVKATVLRSFGTFVVPFFGMGITVKCFHIWGTVLQVIELWDRSWNTPPSCSAQRHRYCLVQELCSLWSYWGLSPPPLCSFHSLFHFYFVQRYTVVVVPLRQGNRKEVSYIPALLSQKWISKIVNLVYCIQREKKYV